MTLDHAQSAQAHRHAPVSNRPEREPRADRQARPFLSALQNHGHVRLSAEMSFDANKSFDALKASDP